MLTPPASGETLIPLAAVVNGVAALFHEGVGVFLEKRERRWMGR